MIVYAVVHDPEQSLTGGGFSWERSEDTALKTAEVGGDLVLGVAHVTVPDDATDQQIETLIAGQLSALETSLRQ